MIFYLDFDGTVVEHAFPIVGLENPKALETILMIQNAGYDIFFNTYRANLGIEYLNDALNFIYNHSQIKIKPFTGILNAKQIPSNWNWKSMLEYKKIYLDDIAPNIPLIPATQVKNKMVDWNKIQKELKKYNII